MTKVLVFILIIASYTLIVADGKSRVKRATYVDVFNMIVNRKEQDAVRLIRDGTSAVFRDPDGLVAMHLAARYGMAGVVKALIDKGYENQMIRVSNSGNLPIHEAVSNDNVNVLMVLLQKVNNDILNKKNNNGKTALHLAVEHGDENAVKLLIKQGADLNLRDNNGDTPLQSAKKNGHQKVADLIERVLKKIKINTHIQRVCNIYLVAGPIDFIINGIAANPEEYPWMAALGYNDTRTNKIDYRCGGTLISPQFILTAAHCIKENNPPIVARLGTISQSDINDARMYDIQEIIKHENYSFRTQRNDIALLRLFEKVRYTSNIRPACLDVDAKDKNETIDLWVSGWGKTSMESHHKSDRLMKAALKTLPLSACSANFSNFAITSKTNETAIRDGLRESQYCAHDPNNSTDHKSDSCFGDSGGPLQMFLDQFTAHIVGIVSFSIGCGYLPGVYTRVAYYTEWIASHVWPEAML